MQAQYRWMASFRKLLSSRTTAINNSDSLIIGQDTVQSWCSMKEFLNKASCYLQYVAATDLGQEGSNHSHSCDSPKSI